MLSIIYRISFDTKLIEKEYDIEWDSIEAQKIKFQCDLLCVVFYLKIRMHGDVNYYLIYNFIVRNLLVWYSFVPVHYFIRSKVTFLRFNRKLYLQKVVS